MILTSPLMGEKNSLSLGVVLEKTILETFHHVCWSKAAYDRWLLASIHTTMSPCTIYKDATSFLADIGIRQHSSLDKMFHCVSFNYQLFLKCS